MSFHPSDIKLIQDMTFHSLNSTFQSSVTLKTCLLPSDTNTLLNSDLCHLTGDLAGSVSQSRTYMRVLKDSSSGVRNGMKSRLVRVLIQKWVSLFTILHWQDLDIEAFLCGFFYRTELGWRDKSPTVRKLLFFVESNLQSEFPAFHNYTTLTHRVELWCVFSDAA